MLIIINAFVISTAQSNLSPRKGEGHEKKHHTKCATQVKMLLVEQGSGGGLTA